MPIQGFQLVFRADSGCSPIRMTAADCCNGDMSNANNNPQGGSAAGSAEPQSQPRPPMYQPQPNRGNRFFAWIRSSRITRGRNRWIAGVCDGVARRLGWNATLVRALVILTSLLFGAERRSTHWPGSCYRTRRMAGSCARSWSTAIGIGTARARWYAPRWRCACPAPDGWRSAWPCWCSGCW